MNNDSFGLTRIRESEPVRLVEELDVGVGPRAVPLGERPGQGEDGAERPDHQDCYQDREQLEHLRGKSKRLVIPKYVFVIFTCILETLTFPFCIVGIITSTFLRYCEQIVMTTIVLIIECNDHL